MLCRRLQHLLVLLHYRFRLSTEVPCSGSLKKDTLSPLPQRDYARWRKENIEALVYDPELHLHRQIFDTERTHELPDSITTVGAECFRCPVLLFPAKLLYQEDRGINDALFLEKTQCGVDVATSSLSTLGSIARETSFRRLSQCLFVKSRRLKNDCSIELSCGTTGQHVHQIVAGSSSG